MTAPVDEARHGDAAVPADLANRLHGARRLGVAVSGGVDSSVLLAAAVRVLGAEHVLAILGVSASLAASERTAAHDVARVIGVELVEVVTREADRPAYRVNGPDRCFHCKDELFSRIEDTVASRYGLDAVAYGENADDAVRTDRPGARAATNHRVLRPLADAGLDKAAVRRLARLWRLPCADKPAAPCLASRIPHFQPVTNDKLAQVERVESALRDLGLSELRVRHHGDVARVELTGDELALAVVEPLHSQIRQAARDAGFRYATVDPDGLQSGAFTLAALADRHG